VALNSQLSYVIASYYLNGTLAGLRQLSDELQLCPQAPDRILAFSLFGTQYDNQCWLSLAALATDQIPTLFYDIYYLDNGENPFFFSSLRRGCS
jgi:hypothetical protein